PENVNAGPNGRISLNAAEAFPNSQELGGAVRVEYGMPGDNLAGLDVDAALSGLDPHLRPMGTPADVPQAPAPTVAEAAQPGPTAVSDTYHQFPAGQDRGTPDIGAQGPVPAQSEVPSHGLQDVDIYAQSPVGPGAPGGAPNRIDVHDNLTFAQTPNARVAQASDVMPPPPPGQN